MSLPHWRITFIGRTLNMSVNERKSKAHNLKESWALSKISDNVLPTTTQSIVLNKLINFLTYMILVANYYFLTFIILFLIGLNWLEEWNFLSWFILLCSLVLNWYFFFFLTKNSRRCSRICKLSHSLLHDFTETLKRIFIFLTIHYSPSIKFFRSK